MRTLIATTAVAAAALLTIPAPSAEAGGLFYRDRAPAAAYYAPAPRRYYRAPMAAYFAPAPRRYYRARAVAPAYYSAPARRGCLFGWFGWGRRGAR